MSSYKRFRCCPRCDRYIEGAAVYSCIKCGGYGCFAGSFWGADRGCYLDLYCPTCDKHKTMEKIGYVERPKERD